MFIFSYFGFVITIVIILFVFKFDFRKLYQFVFCLVLFEKLTGSFLVHFFNSENPNFFTFGLV